MAAASTSIDTIILGGGWSGLLSALRLSQAGRKIIVLEARERIGGRAFTHSWDQSTGLKDDRTSNAQDKWTADFGCSWIHGYNEGNPTRAIAESYGIKSNVPKPTPTQIIGPKGPLSKSLTEKLSTNLSKAQSSLLDIARNKGETSPDSNQSIASILLKDDSPLFKNLKDSTEKEFAISLARSLHVPLGATLEEISLKWYGFENNFSGTDASPEGGFTKLIDLIAKDAKNLGCEIKLGEIVKEVEQREDGRIRIITKNQEGENEKVYEAETVLCTIPLSVLKESLNVFKPSLSERRKATIARTHVGSLNKVLLTYSSPWWSSEIGTFMILPTSKPDPNSSTNNNSIKEILSQTTLTVSSLSSPNGLPGSNPSLLIYVGTPASLEIEKFNRSDVVKALHEILSPRISKTTNASTDDDGEVKSVEEPIHTFYSRWNKQPFTKGSTTTPVLISKEGEVESTPLDFRELGLEVWKGRLGFAGEHTELDHRGSVAGAVVSAERESKRIERFLEGLKGKAKKVLCEKKEKGNGEL